MSISSSRTGIVLPASIYAATAILCWLAPSRVAIHDNTLANYHEVIINAAPTNALALAAVVLFVAHVILKMSGKVAAIVSGCWAAATVWMVTFFFAATLHPPNRMAWAVIYFIGIVTLGSSACGLLFVAWQMVRRRIATDSDAIPRGIVALGLVILGISLAVRTPRTIGPYGPPVTLEQLAGDAAEFTISLWIVSGLLVLGAGIAILVQKDKPDVST